MESSEAKTKEIDKMMEEIKNRTKYRSRIITVEDGMLCKVVVGKTDPGEYEKDGPPIKIIYEPAETADNRQVVLVLPKAKNK